MSMDLINLSSFGHPYEKESKAPEPKLEFPEIQVIPAKSEASSDSTSHGFGKRPVLIGDAKKRFSKMAMKVLTKIVVDETKAIEEEQPEEKKKKTGKSKAGHGSPRSGGVSPVPSRNAAGSLPDLTAAISGGQRDSLKAPPNQFASLVRLARFRRMTNAFGRCSQASSRRTSITDIEEEDDLPNIPRFCATLSPEAQYATMKGYEDVLLDNIKSVNCKSEYNNMLYRVKTPHQTVVALHITEPADVSDALESRTHFTVSRPPSSFDGMDQSFSRTWTTLHRDPRPGNVFGRGQTLPSLAGGKTYEPTESQVKRIRIPKQKQLKLTYKFQRAMDILDTLRDSQGLPVTSTTRKKKVTNPVAFYNSWSQSWAREFKFEYSKS